jgi:hypothetical protein
MNSPPYIGVGIFLGDGVGLNSGNQNSAAPRVRIPQLCPHVPTVLQQGLQP